MPESFRREFRIDANHPCLEGHFPDQPVVPGIVLLELVRIATEEWKPGTRIKSFPVAKFHRPLCPDQSFMLILTEKGADSIGFLCCREDQQLVSGSLTLEPRG